jgi:hypothetical protein
VTPALHLLAFFEPASCQHKKIEPHPASNRVVYRLVYQFDKIERS